LLTQVLIIEESFLELVFRCVRIFKNLAGLVAKAHESKANLMSPNCNETYKNRLLEELKSDQKKINELQKLLSA